MLLNPLKTSQGIFHPAALLRNLRKAPESALHAGLNPAYLGYRWIAHETLHEYFGRVTNRTGERLKTIHEETVARNPLPCNINDRRKLPSEKGWWGYSFWDVPARLSQETAIATLRNCKVVFYRDENKEFYPAIVNQDRRSLTLPQVVFRPPHGAIMRRGQAPLRIEKATWILERVYENYSHWVTAHLPKICLLRERALLDDLILPPNPRPFITDSLRMLGVDPAKCHSFDPNRPLAIGELTIMSTDRFRAELLRPVREAIGTPPQRPPWRKVYVSRSRATRRRLLNENDLWEVLEKAGFESVAFEDLSFEQQVQLMSETAVLCAPHGAGLSNMMFCPPGTDVIEIADLGFPNPNFYALASAMQHRYFLVEASGVGDVHPLEQDLRVCVEKVRNVLKLQEQG